MDTVTLTIDGREVTVAKGTTVLQAAIESGINVPYYCYHPGLGVDGNCRVCLVKVEKMPKLQVSCSITAAEGMVVHTQTPDVVKARAGVFEFLLLNHPLDCPVCDKGGECPLQDFSYSFGPDSSRNEFSRRVFDGEGVKADVDFGPTLMLNRNRCIMCTRCIRFMREIDGDAQIGVLARGNSSEIATFEERGIHSILSGNLMDVCPVGAITTRDYRFKSRPWDNPSAVDTICTLCEKGCNTTAWLRAKPEWAKGATLVRFTPRLNPDVNQFWMCDVGRFNYHWIESDQRLTRPIVSSAQGQQAATWNQALDRLRDELTAADGQIRFLLSAHASHEELFVFAKLGQALLGDKAQHAFDVAWTSSVKVQPPNTKFVVPPVDAPNVAGARMFGLVDDVTSAPDIAGLKQAVGDGSVKVLYVFDPGPEGSIGDTTWIVDAKKAGRIGTLVVQGVLMTPLAASADIVLPGAAFIEKDASYTNDQGRLQFASRAFPAPGEALEDAAIVLKVAKATGYDLGYASGAAVRHAIAETLPDEPGLAGIGSATFGEARAATHWLQSSNASERVKWDTLFQDLPPVKFADMLRPRPAGDVIPLRKVD
ncbi:NADH-quinone oxidoreductase subunit 3 [Luteitalea pratensis]|uniref:NADH-quinone oxidoreductase subunit 3 n=1 Tax=Luteitalea pratensis TaxID=1855912 RepID=A0A143PXG1_LUTPR|nr:2Fe-2S iron-sulfur cluster-binding protein [Luteitalea pratensis]AMY12908.1 NADH-quinone oxidoreductase subunit 3 [Luteitalea pratensis]